MNGRTRRCYKIKFENLKLMILKLQNPYFHQRLHLYFLRFGLRGFKLIFKIINRQLPT